MLPISCKAPYMFMSYGTVLHDYDALEDSIDGGVIRPVLHQMDDPGVTERPGETLAEGDVVEHRGPGDSANIADAGEISTKSFPGS